MGVAVDAVSAGNKYIVCQFVSRTTSFGHFIHGHNPFNFSVPLILFQLSIIIFTSQVIEFCLRPLGQSSIVAQILGGVVYGPSLLGKKPFVSMVIFPVRSIPTLETFASFGMIFFLFAMGVKQDMKLMIRPGRKAAAIGLSAMFGTMAFALTFSTLMKTHVKMDETLSHALPYIAASQGLTPFPNIACLLTELKLASSDLGRLANSASMMCDLIGISVVVVTLGVLQSTNNTQNTFWMILTTFLFLIVLVCVGGPIIRWVAKMAPKNKPLPDHYVIFLFMGALLSGLASEVIGQHFMLGPMVFGLLVPDGQPLGDPIISKLDYPICKLLYPTFLTTSGLKTNFFKIDEKSFWVVILLILFSFIFKVVSVIFVSPFLSINFHDSVVVGLMLNARGTFELILYNLLRDSAVLTDQEFALCVGSVILITAIITPLIKILYDPSRNLIPLRRRTIQHLKQGAELRIFICIKNQDNVPAMMKLLEASNATEDSPIAVIAILLIELVGRATPMLISHQCTRTLVATNSRSGQIINALHQYELGHENCVTVQSFSSSSHTEDICRLALDQNGTLIVLPFHRHWEIDGSVWSENRAAQNVNTEILNRAPCSVAILVDRGLLKGSLAAVNGQTNCNVAVIYIGGPDDAESLSYGARMGRHMNVRLTIIRFLFLGCDTARERRQDNLLIDEVREANIENQNFAYQEQVLKDRLGLVDALQKLDNSFDLLIVGKCHQSSQMLYRLGDWSQCPELGAVGDILAAPDFKTTASVLVVRQQRLKDDKLQKRMMKPAVISHGMLHETPKFSSSVSVSGSETTYCSATSEYGQDYGDYDYDYDPRLHAFIG